MMSAESVNSWAESDSRSSHFQSPECQSLIGLLRSFLVTELASPEDGAKALTEALQSIIDANPMDPRAVSIWSVFSDAVRALGANQAISKRFLGLLNSIKTIDIKDIHGRPVEYAWGGAFWKDMPAFGMIFREYAMDLDPVDGMDVDTWIDQKNPLLNATSFAAIALTSGREWDSMSFFVPVAMKNMCEALNDSEEPDSRYRLEIFLPIAIVWLNIAGTKIYALCREGARENMRTEHWHTWRKGFEQIVANDQVMENTRDEARNALKIMDGVERDA